MPLPSFLKRSRATRGTLGAAQAAALDPGVIEQARIRARRRLVGAAILVLVGVVGFPLLFDTQPRPVPANVAVQVAHGDGRVSLAAPAQMPSEQSNAEAEGAEAERTGPSTRQPAPPRAPDRGDKTTRNVDATASRPADTSTASPAERATAAASHADTSARRPAATTPKPAAPSAPAVATARPRDDGARAQALLEGREPSPAAAGRGAAAGPAVPVAPNDAAAAGQRYVVQVGAFSDAAAAREVRLKVERLGIKTYTQVIGSNDMRRIRVRVGPFEQKQAAEQTMAKIRQAGLSAAVLTL